MKDFPFQSVTQLLQAHARGEEGAITALFTRVYDQLHALAQQQLGYTHAGQVLSTSTLVHESFLKLTAQENCAWKNPAHFFAVAAMAMRQILVDEARKRAAQKRGGNTPHVTLQESALLDNRPHIEILDLDAALTKLATLHPRLSQLVEIRFFAGLSIPEAAQALDVSTRTVDRDWQKAKALLHLFLTDSQRTMAD